MGSRDDWTIENIKSLPTVNTTAAKGEIHKFHDEETDQNYYLKVLSIHGRSLNFDVTTGIKTFEMMPTKIAP